VAAHHLVAEPAVGAVAHQVLLGVDELVRTLVRQVVTAG
jgi:hypothetical protein